MIVWTPAPQTNTSDVHHRDYKAVIILFNFKCICFVMYLSAARKSKTQWLYREIFVFLV